MINGKDWTCHHDQLIVWNEIICKYGSVKNIMPVGEYFRTANKEEILIYLKTNL